MKPSTQNRLIAMERELLDARTHSLRTSTKWARRFPSVPGVYAVWDSSTGDVVYVGETSCLQDRMVDLGRWENHTCRRKLGKSLGCDGADESGLTRKMAARYRVAAIPVSFGRREFEEYLRRRWAKTLLNKRSPRVAKNAAYDWVAPSRPQLEKSGPRAFTVAV